MDVDDVIPPPHKLPWTGSGHVGSLASQGVCPPCLDNVSTGDSTGPTPSVTSEPPVSPVDNHHLAYSLEAPMLSRQCCQATVCNNTADVVILMANPSQGPMTGGTQIWICGLNFPTDLMPLYARFGDDCACVVGVYHFFGKHLTTSRT